MGFKRTNTNPAVDDGGTERPFDGESLGVTDYVRLAASIDSTSAGSATAVTDGGQHEGPDESDRTALQQLFEDVTGTTTVATRQHSSSTERSVVDSEEQSLSATVADVVREDGLDDALSEPDTDTPD